MQGLCCPATVNRESFAEVHWATGKGCERRRSVSQETCLRLIIIDVTRYDRIIDRLQIFLSLGNIGSRIFAGVLSLRRQDFFCCGFGLSLNL